MDLDVATALDRDLYKRRSALGGRCQPREIVDQEVAQAVDLRHLCRVDSQRSAKDRLELLAVDLFAGEERRLAGVFDLDLLQSGEQHDGDSKPVCLGRFYAAP